MKEIGDDAFSDCAKLSQLHIPAGVTKIASGTFDSCYSLSHITIPEGVTEIGERAFFECLGLTSITIPASVTTIEREAFSASDNLARIEIAAGNPRFKVENGLVLSADGKTVEFCTPGLSGLCEIPQGVRNIAWYAFSQCQKLTGVLIPPSVTTIGAGAFGGCSKLASLTLPPKMKKISAYFCLDCKSLREVTLPPALTSIGTESFAGTALETVTIPATVTTMKARAFQGCHLRRAVLQGELKLSGQILGKAPFELIAGEIPFSQLPQAYRVCGVLGFAACYQEGQALGEEYQAECLQYIKGQRKRLYPLAMKHPALLSVMVSEKLIPKEDMENLLQQAAKLKRAELNAMLLEYQSRTFGAMDPELELEKELRRERKRQQKLSEEGGLPDAGE